MKKTVALGISGALTMIVPVHSQTIPTDYFRDAQYNIYLMGQSPSSTATLTYSNLPKSRTITTDNCGRVIWRTSATNPVPALYSYSVDGIANSQAFSTTAGVPTAELTRCNPDGQAAYNGTSGTYRTAIGDFVTGGRERPPNAPVQIFYEAQKVRKVKANLCGVVRWGNTATTPHNDYTSIVLQDGDSVSLNGVETRKPPFCRLGQLYIPAEWLGGSGGGGGGS
jgi:hypothetical protein